MALVERGRSRKRRKTRWSDQLPIATTSSLSVIPKYIPAGLSIEQQEALLVRVRIEEITRKLTMNDLDIDYTNERDRSPSPEPVYDAQGKRVNTREQRAKNKLNAERHSLVLLAKSMNPLFKPPADYVAAGVQKATRKIPIPVDQYPDYNFIGLIIGPRGNTQKRMEKDTRCKISIRGKGSVKEGKNRTIQPDDHEPLHVLVTGDTEEDVAKAASMIQKLLVPIDETQNEHKMLQLRELAEINGTLRDRRWFPTEPASFEMSNVKCAHCGEVSHPTSDCPFKNSGLSIGAAKSSTQQQIESEYEKFLTEIGDSPPQQPSYAQQSTTPENTDAAYQEFLASINNQSSTQQQAQDQQQQPWQWQNGMQMPGQVPWAQQNPWQQYAAYYGGAYAQAAPWQTAGSYYYNY
jgi:splicing factor 1